MPVVAPIVAAPHNMTHEMIFFMGHLLPYGTMSTMTRRYPGPEVRRA
jgi:hypothetical protein